MRCGHHRVGETLKEVLYLIDIFCSILSCLCSFFQTHFKVKHMVYGIKLAVELGRSHKVVTVIDVDKIAAEPVH